VGSGRSEHGGVCPYCAEAIQPSAIKCRFCGEWLDEQGGFGDWGSTDEVRIAQPLPQRRMSTVQMGTREAVALCGCAVLAIGAFCPVVSAPFGVELTLFNNGNGDGVVLLGLSRLILVSRSAKFSWLAGGSALGLVAYDLNHASSYISSSSNPFVRATVQLQWGWVVMIVGAALLIVAPILGLAMSPRQAAAQSAQVRGHDGENEHVRGTGEIVAWLLLFAPWGLWIMWRGGTWRVAVKWIVTLAWTVVAIAAGVGASRAAQPSQSSQAIVVPTTTPQPTFPTPTPQPATQPATVPTSASDVASAVVAAVRAYHAAAQAAYGQAHDAGQVDATMIGTVRVAVLCVMRNRSDSLINTNAYFTYQELSDQYDPPTVTGNSATVAEHKHELLTIHRADGTASTEDNVFTVTYTLAGQSGGWLVSDYAYVSSTGFAGSASADAKPCSA
jgi:hypothetical protein